MRDPGPRRRLMQLCWTCQPFRPKPDPAFPRPCNQAAAGYHQHLPPTETTHATVRIQAPVNERHGLSLEVMAGKGARKIFQPLFFCPPIFREGFGNDFGVSGQSFPRTPRGAAPRKCHRLREGSWASGRASILPRLRHRPGHLQATTSCVAWGLSEGRLGESRGLPGIARRPTGEGLFVCLFVSQVSEGAFQVPASRIP